MPRGRVERIVSRALDAGDGERRQQHLREQPIDQQLVFLVAVLVEQARALNLIVAAEADVARDPPPHFRREGPPGEIEARSNLLLDRARQKRVV